MREMGRRRRRRRARVAAAILVVLAAGLALSLWLTLGRGPTLITVRIAGAEEVVSAGTALVEAAARFRLEPKDGSLLDVEGRVLRAGVYRGRLLVNGLPAAGATVLHAGDTVTVVDGRDRSERLAREVVPVPAGEPSDPQFFLVRTPGKQIVVRGALSHKLVSSEFRPTGKPRTLRAVALTFDDGPWPVSTERILAVLKRLHAPATFFVIGTLAERYPELVRDELRAGMAVASHSYSHPNSPPFAKLSRRRIREEIEKGQAALSGVGVQASLFRPPGGSFSPYVVRAAGRLGQRVVLWSVDPTDWRPGTTAKQLRERVLRAVRAGSIVVLHDGGGDRSATVKALPAIIEGIRKKGLRLELVEPRGEIALTHPRG